MELSPDLSLTELLILVLATAQVIEVYPHSSLFAVIRARLESFDNFFGDLFACMFCLSVWVGAGLTVWFFCTLAYPAWRLPIYALAVTRGANILNDVLHKFCRTPRVSDMFDD